MAGILARLEPLAEIVEATPDPIAACAALLEAAHAGNTGALLQVTGPDPLAVTALRYAGIVDAEHRLLPSARDDLLRLEGIVSSRAADHDRWSAVVTVPSYLRRRFPQGQLSETFPVLFRLFSDARRRVIMASPFLDKGFDSLIPAIAAFTGRGGNFLLVTRELTNPASKNAAAIRLLRRHCLPEAGLEVVSWEEEGLGLHMKAAVADSCRAYVGSANFTWGGMSDHAELGVYLDGPAVGEIERLLDVLASELRGRRRLQSR